MLRFRPLGVSRELRGSPGSMATPSWDPPGGPNAAEVAGEDSVEADVMALVPVAGSATHTTLSVDWGPSSKLRSKQDSGSGWTAARTVFPRSRPAMFPSR